MKQSTTLKAIPKRCAVIQDIAGFGRCSHTIALPVLSVMQIQPCPVPTSIFSNHTAFPLFSMKDETTFLPDYFHSWKKLGLTFDGIYCGFLGNSKQISIISEFITNHPESLIIIDPVMGDHGKAYRTVNEDFITQISRLVSLANVITPNITEACLLTDTPYKAGEWSEEELAALTDKLHQLGPQHIIITGMQDEQSFLNYISTQKSAASSTPSKLSIQTPLGGSPRHGTGDLFASIVTAELLKNNNKTDDTDVITLEQLKLSTIKAANFIHDCTLLSDELSIPPLEGVCFENLLSSLI